MLANIKVIIDQIRSFVNKKILHDHNNVINNDLFFKKKNDSHTPSKVPIITSATIAAASNAGVSNDNIAASISNNVTASGKAWVPATTDKPDKQRVKSTLAKILPKKFLSGKSRGRSAR